MTLSSLYQALSTKQVDFQEFVQHVVVVSPLWLHILVRIAGPGLTVVVCLRMWRYAAAVVLLVLPAFFSITAAVEAPDRTTMLMATCVLCGMSGMATSVPQLLASGVLQQLLGVVLALLLMAGVQHARHCDCPLSRWVAKRWLQATLAVLAGSLVVQGLWNPRGELSPTSALLLLMRATMPSFTLLISTLMWEDRARRYPAVVDWYLLRAFAFLCTLFMTGAFSWAMWVNNLLMASAIMAVLDRQLTHVILHGPAWALGGATSSSPSARSSRSGHHHRPGRHERRRRTRSLTSSGAGAVAAPGGGEVAAEAAAAAGTQATAAATAAPAAPAGTATPPAAQPAAVQPAALAVEHVAPAAAVRASPSAAGPSAGPGTAAAAAGHADGAAEAGNAWPRWDPQPKRVMRQRQDESPDDASSDQASGANAPAAAVAQSQRTVTLPMPMPPAAAPPAGPSGAAPAGNPTAAVPGASAPQPSSPPQPSVAAAAPLAAAPSAPASIAAAPLTPWRTPAAAAAGAAARAAASPASPAASPATTITAGTPAPFSFLSLRMLLMATSVSSATQWLVCVPPLSGISIAAPLLRTLLNFVGSIAAGSALCVAARLTYSGQLAAALGNRVGTPVLAGKALVVGLPFAMRALRMVWGPLPSVAMGLLAACEVMLVTFCVVFGAVTPSMTRGSSGGRPSLRAFVQELIHQARLRYLLSQQELRQRRIVRQLQDAGVFSAVQQAQAQAAARASGGSAAQAPTATAAAAAAGAAGTVDGAAGGTSSAGRPRVSCRFVPLPSSAAVGPAGAGGSSAGAVQQGPSLQERLSAVAGAGAAAASRMMGEAAVPVFAPAGAAAGAPAFDFGAASSGSAPRQLPATPPRALDPVLNTGPFPMVFGSPAAPVAPDAGSHGARGESGSGMGGGVLSDAVPQEGLGMAGDGSGSAAGAAGCGAGVAGPHAAPAGAGRGAARPPVAPAGQRRWR